MPFFANAMKKYAHKKPRQNHCRGFIIYTEISENRETFYNSTIGLIPYFNQIQSTGSYQSRHPHNYYMGLNPYLEIYIENCQQLNPITDRNIYSGRSVRRPPRAKCS